MTNGATKRPKQRTKAGCLICRQKRKKCDEKVPACDRCTRSGSQCQWPSSADLVDRRFASHSEFRHRKSTQSVEPETALVPAKPSLLLEAGAVHTLVSRDIETAITLHFDGDFASLIMVPGGHPSFFDDWAVQIMHLRTVFKAFYYAQLACSASHLHYKNVSAQMQELALTYYCNAVSQLAQLLASNLSGLEQHNGVIMCILTLCLHGATGRGTTADMQRHVEAVTKLLTLRIQSDPSVIGRPFDRLGVECALHQYFLINTGCWTDNNSNAPDLDLKFWNLAEGLLDQSNLYLHRPEGFRTPVVGLPASLLRIILILRHQFRSPNHVDQSVLNSIRPWVVFWEKKSDHLVAGVSSDTNTTIYDKIREDASHLYAIVASLLFEQLLQGDLSATFQPRPVSSCSWQIRRAMDVMLRNSGSDDWARYAMCDFAVYTMGLFVTTCEDMERVRWDMQRRWEACKSGQAIRYCNDLEAIWAARTSPQTSPSEAPTFSDDPGSQTSSSAESVDSPPEQHSEELVMRIRQHTPYTHSLPPFTLTAPDWNHPYYQDTHLTGIPHAHAFSVG